MEHATVHITCAESTFHGRPPAKTRVRGGAMRLATKQKQGNRKTTPNSLWWEGCLTTATATQHKINSQDPQKRRNRATYHPRLSHHPEGPASKLRCRNVQGSNPGENDPEGREPDVLSPKEGGHADTKGLHNTQGMLEIKAKRVWAYLAILAHRRMRSTWQSELEILAGRKDLPALEIQDEAFNFIIPLWHSGGETHCIWRLTTNRQTLD